MKKLIRKNVFETNSSSTHSISVDNSFNLYESLELNENDNVVLTGGEFGWGWSKHNDALVKANYILVYIMDWVSKDLKKQFFNTFYSVIKEQTQCNDIEILRQDNEVFLLSTLIKDIEFGYDIKLDELFNWFEDRGIGYIDHQAVENQDWHYLFDNQQELKDFIFNKNKTLVIGNDNSSNPYTILDYEEMMKNPDYYKIEEIIENKNTPLEIIYKILEMTKDDIHEDDRDDFDSYHQEFIQMIINKNVLNENDYQELYEKYVLNDFHYNIAKCLFNSFCVPLSFKKQLLKIALQNEIPYLNANKENRYKYDFIPSKFLYDIFCLINQAYKFDNEFFEWLMSAKTISEEQKNNIKNKF